MKWNEYEKEEGVYDWSRIDYIYAKAKECGENSEENISECTSTQLVAPEGTRYGAGVCGHALFWHTNQGEPGWAFKDKEGKKLTPGDPDSIAHLKRRMRKHASALNA